jgi:3-deoxy-D-manno-octulosonic-acid transferase
LNFIAKWPGKKFVLSTTTTTGQAIARKRSPENVTVIYMPIDFRFAVKKAFNVIKPKALVIFEVEIWPNLLFQAKKRNIPIALVNGRMSDKSFKGFTKHSWFFQPIFNLFSLICVQSEADAARFAGVSGGQIKPIVCNTMKFDQAPSTDAALSPDTMKKYFKSESPVIFNAASTHPGEEKLIIDIYKKLKVEVPNLVLLLVPRHVERTPEIELLLKEEGVEYNLFKNSLVHPSDILLVNVTGELLSLISISDIVYVGKSLAGNEGGHNIIEPAVFGKPVLHGVNMQNFRLVVDAFTNDKSSTIVTEESFEQTLLSLLKDEEKRKALGKAALKTVNSNSGAINKTIEALNRLI